MKTFYLALAFALLSACKKDPAPDSVPPFVFALLDKQSNNLFTSTSTPVQVYCYDSSGKAIYLGSECAGGGCTMVRQGYSSTGNPKYKLVYQSMGMTELSETGYKTWYINLGGKVDTLFFDSQNSLFKSVIFNGQAASIDPDQQPVYPLQRRH